MRVIAGTRRSLPLRSLEGDATRPTADRYKETLFNVLQNDVPGARFLDLFAGSGAIGIEALSRGARHAVFVENSRKAVSVIRENIHFTKFEEEADILLSDAISYVRGLSVVDFDVIFIDPPYHGELYERTFSQLSEMKYVTENTMIITESSLDMDFSFAENYGFEVRRVKEYKSNKHVFLYRKARS